MTRRLLVLTCLVLLAATACGTRSSTPPVTPPSAHGLPTAAASFATLAPVPLGAGVPAYAGPATPHSLAGVKIAKTLRKPLAPPGVSEVLAKNGFVVVPAGFQLFQMAYEGNVYEGWPVFVTTDVAYHDWHLVFDKILRSLE